MKTRSFGDRVLVRDFVFWSGLAFMFLSVATPYARHLIYLVPFMVLLTVLGDRGLRIGDEAKPFLIFVLAGLVFSPLGTNEGLRDIFFTFAGVSVAFLVGVPRVKLWHLFIGLAVSMAIYFALFGDFRSGIKFDVSKSSSSFEGSFSFMFGMLAPFALMEKRYRLAILCVLMAVLSLKRIAVLSALVACFFVLLGEKRARLILNPPVMIALNCILLLAVLMYGYGSFDFLILEFTGESSNEFGQGRKVLLAFPAIEIFSHPENFVVFGQGPGSTYVLANKAFSSFTTAQRLHSDLLKIFYEYGFIIFCLFIGYMYSARRFSTRIAFLFMNVLFLTDNTLIYAFVLFLFVCCCRNVDRPVPVVQPDLSFSPVQVNR
jgi:hypothetical protein